MAGIGSIGDDLFEAFFADEEPEKKKKPEVVAADEEATPKPATKKTNKKKRVTSIKKATSTAKPETPEFQHTPALLDLAQQSEKKDQLVSCDTTCMHFYSYTNLFDFGSISQQNNETAEKTTDSPDAALDDEHLDNVITIAGSDDAKQEDITEDETSADEPAETGAKESGSDSETAESSIVEAVAKAPATKKKPLKKKDKDEES